MTAKTILTPELYPTDGKESCPVEFMRFEEKACCLASKSVDVHGILESENIIHNLPQMIWATDQNGQCVYINKMFEDFTGVPCRSLMNASWIKSLHPDDVDTTVTNWQDSVSRKIFHRAQYRIRRSDNTYRWCLARAFMVENPNGRPKCWVGTNIDIHDVFQLFDSSYNCFDLEENAASVSKGLGKPTSPPQVKDDWIWEQPKKKRGIAQDLESIIKDFDRIDELVAEIFEPKQV